MRAFSLAEITVFLGIVSLAVLAAISVQIYSLRGTTFNRTRHTASTLVYSELSAAQQKLAIDYNGLPPHGPLPVSDRPEFSSVLENVYADSSEHLRKVTVTVSWGASAEHHFSAWTYVYHAP